ncbi:MAG: hypothetical protein ABR889_03035 [Acidobacteriaceae bacterium]
MALEKTQNAYINLAFVGISRRAESVDRETLVQTFVDVGPLFAVLSTKDHQVVFGRRGTGKTHALLYVAEQNKLNNNVSIYIDLRYIGSSGGLYGDPSLPLSQRATRLLLDVLGTLHEELLATAVDGNLDLSKVGPALDKLATAATDIEVVGETKLETKQTSGTSTNDASDFKVSFSDTPSASASVGHTSTQNVQHEGIVAQQGVARCRVHFGSVSTALRDVVAAVVPSRILIVLDEWGTIPLDLQPYLADLIRRAFFPVPGITVKIAAIEQRSLFRLGSGPDYLGIEIGADASADVDLDDYMVFDNNKERAIEFFRELLFSHYQSETAENKPDFASSHALISAAFTQINAFEDFVRSAEGVPRDAFNILSVAAQRGMNDRISIPTIRIAARTWYQRDKETAIKSNVNAYRLLTWIINEVIAHRKARAFLLTANSRHPLIDALFDSRLLHIVKKGLSGQELAGARYDAYKLDYGCYVDLLSTKSAPVGSFFDDEPEEKSADIVVPTDDYRAIRRAVLNLDEFEAAS